MIRTTPTQSLWRRDGRRTLVDGAARDGDLGLERDPGERAVRAVVGSVGIEVSAVDDDVEITDVRCDKVSCVCVVEAALFT